MCKLRIPVDRDDKEIEVTIDERSRMARVTVLRETGEYHAVEVDLDSGERRPMAVAAA